MQGLDKQDPGIPLGKIPCFFFGSSDSPEGSTTGGRSVVWVCFLYHLDFSLRTVVFVLDDDIPLFRVW